MDRDDVTSAGLTAIGIVAGAVAQAVALGGRLVAAGLGTIENALRGEETADLHTRGRPSPSTARTAESDEGPDEDSGEGFARPAEPAFEPADGVTAPARPARSAIRRSSAGAAARTAPGPRPAKRATAKSLPPNLRPVEPREPAPEPAKAAKATATKATATKTTATKTTATRTTAKKAATKTTAKKAAKKTATDTAETAAAETSPATGTTAVTTSAAAKNAAKKASPSTRTAKKAPAEQGAATRSAESAHTRPEGTSDAGQGSVRNP